MPARIKSPAMDATSSNRPEFDTFPSTAKRIPCGPRLLRAAVVRGELHAYRLDDRWIRLNWPEVVAWIKAHRISPKSHDTSRAVEVLKDEMPPG